jgi:CheY-like chemotaxis protein
MVATAAQEDDIEVAVREVLIVEDEARQRQEFATFFAKHGFVVHAAADREQALALARGFPTSVVVMDIMFYSQPEGLEIAHAIQQLQPLQSLIFLTAFDRLDYRQRAADLGLRVDAWLHKPPVPSELLRKVERESRKMEIRGTLAQVRASSRGRVRLIRQLTAPDLDHYPGIDEELIAEALWDDPMAPDPAIDRLYSQIRALVWRSAQEPDARAAIPPLMQQLRTLQERRADDLERRYRSRLLVQPEELQQALDDARNLLKK